MRRSVMGLSLRMCSLVEHLPKHVHFSSAILRLGRRMNLAGIKPGRTNQVADALSWKAELGALKLEEVPAFNWSEHCPVKAEAVDWRPVSPN
ncbi:hypothetical protein AMTR_s00188p00042670 [Amborella trichopoda]|uniref:Uncharacterized protein n=1 Tax=Amborella trichopoda TaxID=13333 RepID=W1NKP2_AMBTC|nr:hypothetical protein AMTR_s00188p00042670 [Amborella trichopoda]